MGLKPQRPRRTLSVRKTNAYAACEPDDHRLRQAQLLQGLEQGLGDPLCLVLVLLKALHTYAPLTPLPEYSPVELL
jgi:hypothetical protein